MSRSLRIAPGLTLPIEAVTESIAILAKRGAGKTYTASVLVEEMLKSKLQVIVLDPVGAWWGLRSSADGKGEGFSIAILGGDRGDVPLEPTGGSVAADLLVDERLPAILDLASFSKNERRSFVAAFLERLYQRNREAMHVVLEEADLFAPEGKLKRSGDEQMLGAVYDLVRRGRGRGLGSTLITQRSASLSKEVLTQAEILLALRTTGPHDRAAIEEWIKFHGSKDERDIVLTSLAELPTGEAWAWWPVEGILKRIKIRKRETFDSSATPKPGQIQREPKTLADVDLAALQERMAATIEKAKAEDPRTLRKRIIELEQLVRKQDRGLTKPSRVETVVEEKIVEKIVELPMLAKLELQRLEENVSDLRSVADQIEAAARDARAIAETAAKRGDSSAGRAPVRRAGEVGSKPAPRSRPAPTAPLPALDGDVKFGKGEQTVLDVLAEYPEGRTYNELAFLAGYSAKASTLGVILSNLRKAGLVEPGNQPIRATAEGFEAAGGIRERPTGQALLDQWLRHPRMGEGERRVLLELIEWHDTEPSHEELCERTGYSSTASTMGVILSKLRKLGIVEKGARRVTPEFMEAIAV